MLLRIYTVFVHVCIHVLKKLIFYISRRIIIGTRTTRACFLNCLTLCDKKVQCFFFFFLLLCKCGFQVTMTPIREHEYLWRENRTSWCRCLVLFTFSLGCWLGVGLAESFAQKTRNRSCDWKKTQNWLQQHSTSCHYNVYCIHLHGVEANSVLQSEKNRRQSLSIHHQTPNTTINKLLLFGSCT